MFLAFCLNFVHIFKQTPENDIYFHMTSFYNQMRVAYRNKYVQENRKKKVYKIYNISESS